MINPLFVFSGAALAAMAALLGVTADKWNEHPVPGTGVELSSGSADPAPAPATTSTAEKEDAGSPAKETVEGSEPVSWTKTAAVSTEQPAANEAPSPAVPDAAPDDSKPSFDTIRVDPDGTAVLAGRGLPDSEVTILFNDQPIGSAKTDPAGAWVMVPPEPLPVGDHQVTLRMQQPDAAPVSSEQSIALKVPERGADRALVVLSENNRPSRVLQQPRSAVEVAPVKPPEPAADSVVADPAAESAVTEPPAMPAATEPPASAAAEPPAMPAAAEPPAMPAAAEPPADSAAESTVAAVNPDVNANAAADTAASPPQPRADLPLNLATVDYNDGGDILFAGTADGGATVRLYVDNNHVGDARVEAGGNWQFAGKENIRPGTHNLRVDKLHADGSVAERVELPFVRADPTAVAALIQQPPVAFPVQSSPAPDEPAPRGVSSVTGGAGAGTAEKTAEITSSGQAQLQPKVASAEPPAAASVAEELVAAAPVQDPAASAEAADTVAEPPAAAPAAEELVAAAPAQDPAAGAEAADTVAEPPAAAPAAEELVAAAPVQDPAAGAEAADAVTEPPAAAPAAEKVVAAPTQDPASGPDAADTVAEPPAATPAAEEVVAAAPTQDPATGPDAADTVAEPPAAAPAAEEAVAAAPTRDPVTSAEVVDTGSDPQAVAPVAAETPEIAQSRDAASAQAEALSASSSATAESGSPAHVPTTSSDAALPTPPADAAAASSASAVSPSSGGAAGLAVAAGAPEAGQPRNGRVVIQPGNNLWRISRVIYGEGVQYTVIYQANKEQIRNPDLIYPGQIFATPGVLAPEMIDPKQKEPLPGVAGGTTSG